MPRRHGCMFARYRQTAKRRATALYGTLEAPEKADRRAHAFNLRRSVGTGDGSDDARSSASAARPTSGIT